MYHAETGIMLQTSVVVMSLTSAVMLFSSSIYQYMYVNAEAVLNMRDHSYTLKGKLLISVALKFSRNCLSGVRVYVCVFVWFSSESTADFFRE